MTSRRTFLKGSAAGLGMLAAPAIISHKALASSGEVNFIGWAGYPKLAEVVFPAFEKATGIKVNFTELPDQDAMFAQAKVALEAGGIDVIEPTIDRWGGWNSNGLLQPLDESKLAMDNYLPGLADGDAGERRARTASSSTCRPTGAPRRWSPRRPTPSSLRRPRSATCSTPRTRSCVRPHSSLAAMGRYLDAQGKLPQSVDRRLQGHGRHEASSGTSRWPRPSRPRPMSCSSGRARTRPMPASRTNGATLGLSWDSTGYNLRKDGYGYIAPKEGAFAWHQGFVLMKNAKNVEQAHEFTKFVSTPEGAAGWATAFSANPVGKGAIDLIDPEVKAFYNGTFRRRAGEALVVAGADRRVHHAAQRIRRQVQGGLRRKRRSRRIRTGIRRFSCCIAKVALGLRSTTA